MTRLAAVEMTQDYYDAHNYAVCESQFPWIGWILIAVVVGAVVALGALAIYAYVAKWPE